MHPHATTSELDQGKRHDNLGATAAYDQVGAVALAAHAMSETTGGLGIMHPERVHGRHVPGLRALRYCGSAIVVSHPCDGISSRTMSATARTAELG